MSRRLQAVAHLIKPGLKIADVGTDHAYLPIYLVQQNLIPEAIAIDVHQGPYESAVKQVAEQGLAHKISVLLGDGFGPLQPGQVEAAVLAGMGASTMLEILAAKPEVTSSLKQLILQPMVGVYLLRKWLVENSWQICKEVLVEDDGFIYVAISATPGKQVITDWLTLEVGPYLLQEKPPLLEPYLTKVISDYENILSNLKQARSQEAREKIMEIAEKIRLLKGVLNNGS